MTDFGTSEKPASVRAGDLKPGVLVDSWHFGDAMDELEVQSVTDHGGGLILVVGTDVAGKSWEALLHADRAVQTWGMA